MTCHAEATIAQNRSTFYEEGQPEEVEVEQTYVDEGAIVKVLDEYDEADERTLPVSVLSDEEVGLLVWLLALPFNVRPSCDVSNQDVKVHMGL